MTISKLTSKITVTSIAVIAGLVGTVYYFNTTNKNQTSEAFASVWDQETEPAYSGVKSMTVYRSPSCGCCGVWIDHAQKHEFTIEDIKTEEMAAIKQQYNIPAELASCHTTIIDGYVMEGHIPADDIKRFLTEKPDKLVGLSVPAMPIGTPGMEAKDIKEPFQVFAINDNGQVEVFQEYESY